MSRERREMASPGLEDTRRLIEAHRAWTARAFCMAAAELRGSFEPDRATTRNRRREPRVAPMWKTEAP
jgi:hypothetical protein